jgi:hypothetical protein
MAGERAAQPAYDRFRERCTPHVEEIELRRRGRLRVLDLKVVLWIHLDQAGACAHAETVLTRRVGQRDPRIVLDQVGDSHRRTRREAELDDVLPFGGRLIRLSVVKASGDQSTSALSSTRVLPSQGSASSGSRSDARTASTYSEVLSTACRSITIALQPDAPSSLGRTAPTLRAFFPTSTALAGASPRQRHVRTFGLHRTTASSYTANVPRPGPEAVPFPLRDWWPEPISNCTVTICDTGITLGSLLLDDSEWRSISRASVFSLRIDDHPEEDGWTTNHPDGTQTSRSFVIPNEPIHRRRSTEAQGDGNRCALTSAGARTISGTVGRFVPTAEAAW